VYNTQRLQEHSILADTTTPHEATEVAELKEYLQVQRLSPQGIIPKRVSTNAAVFDLHSAVTVTLAPNTITKIPTNIVITPPPGTYGQILSQSGLLTKHQLEVKAGAIDADYVGNVTIIMMNFSDKEYTVTAGDPIAQLVLYRISQLEVGETLELTPTERADCGFGHTGLQGAIQDADTKSTTTLIVATAQIITTNIESDDVIKPYNIWLNADPFEKHLTVTIPATGKHPTMGLLLKHDEKQHRVQLIDMEKSTPGAKLHRWRSTIRKGTLLQIDDTPIKTLDNVHHAVSYARKQGKPTVACQFATIAYQP